MHYGKFIAEAKFVADSSTYEDLIANADADGLMDLLTFPEQEERVIARVASKAAIFGQDIDTCGNPMKGASYKVEPDLVASIYREWVMPLTKEVQVRASCSCCCFYRAETSKQGKSLHTKTTFEMSCRGTVFCSMNAE